MDNEGLKIPEQWGERLSSESTWTGHETVHYTESSAEALDLAFRGLLPLLSASKSSIIRDIAFPNLQQVWRCEYIVETDANLIEEIIKTNLEEDAQREGFERFGVAVGTEASQDDAYWLLRVDKTTLTILHRTRYLQLLSIFRSTFKGYRIWKYKRAVGGEIMALAAPKGSILLLGEEEKMLQRDKDRNQGIQSQMSNEIDEPSFALWQGIPKTESTFRETVMNKVSLQPTAESTTIYTSWPKTPINIPNFIAPGDIPTCVLTIERTNSDRNELFRAVHEKRLELQLKCHLFPTYPILRFMLDFHKSDGCRKCRSEGIPNITLGDIQSFIVDFIRNGQWRLVMRDTSGRSFEAVLKASEEQRKRFLQESQRATLHYRTIKKDLLDYNAAASRFMKEVPIEDDASASSRVDELRASFHEILPDARARPRVLEHYRSRFPDESEEGILKKILYDYERDAR